METSSLFCLNDDKFYSWLQDVTTHYKSLSKHDRNTVLKELIANSEEKQMEFLDAHLVPLISKDFITLLSMELATIVLKHLSGKEVLTCCQVSRSWRDRINSMTNLWEAKAFEVGVNVDVIVEKYSLHTDMARVFKMSYCLAARFLSGLEYHRIEIMDVHLQDDNSENSIHFTDEHLVLGFDAERRVEIYSIHDWSLTHVVCARYRLLPCFKNNLVFTSDYDGHAYCWDVPTNTDMSIHEIYTSDSDQETIQQVPRSLHKFCMSTHGICMDMILAVDVAIIQDETFVVTGSSVMNVWKMHPTRKKSELVLSLNKVDTVVSRIHCLLDDGDGKLKFISVCPSNIIIWSVDLQTHHQKSSYLEKRSVFNNIISILFDVSSPEQLFVTMNVRDRPVSTLESFLVCRKDVGFKSLDCWKLSKRIKHAKILGVGSRFALFVCKSDLQLFQFYDMTLRRPLATFTIARRFWDEPLKLYNPSSLLDGFNLEELQENEMCPMIVGQASSKVMGMVRLEIPDLEYRLSSGTLWSDDSSSCESGTTYSPPGSDISDERGLSPDSLPSSDEDRPEH